MLFYMKLAIIGQALLFFGGLFGWVIFPRVMEYNMHQKMQLKDTPTRQFWSKFPFSLDFKVWMFNVTNPEEVMKGATPVVKQVGPYIFEEWQEKVNMVDREEDDTVEYQIMNTWHFNQSRTLPLTGQEEIYIPHTFILFMTMAAMRENQNFLPLVGKAIDSIFKRPNSIFVKVKVNDFLFNGLPIDCRVTDIAARGVCSIIKVHSDEIAVDGEDLYRFSFFGSRNATPTKDRLRVLRGVNNLMDIGQVVELNGRKNMTTWNDTECDKISGSDGTIFHPFLYETEDIVSFSPDTCRTFSAHFAEKAVSKGLLINRYTAEIGDASPDDSPNCYCQKPNKCLRKGLMDIYKCKRAPLLISHPHLYLADRSYVELVDGLEPSKEKHQIVLDFEPLTATPLEAWKRVQFNIFIQPIDKIRIFKSLPYSLMPLFWIEEGLELPEFIVVQIQTAVLVVKIVDYVTCCSMLIGFLMCCVALYLYYTTRHKHQKFDITKMSIAGNAEDKY